MHIKPFSNIVVNMTLIGGQIFVVSGVVPQYRVSRFRLPGNGFFDYFKGYKLLILHDMFSPIHS